MSECVVCGGGDFDLLDGLFFCSECGTQSQDVREEVAEQDASSQHVRSLKIGSTKELKRLKAAEKGEKGKCLSQLEKLQLVLQMQSDSLIAMGFDPSLKEAVKLIWFQYLKHFGYAFTSGSNKDKPKENATQAGGSKATAGQKRKGKSKKTTGQKKAKVTNGSSFDTFPDDEHLFSSDSDQSEELAPGLSGEDLWSHNTKKKRNAKNPEQFTIKFTVGVLYLGLLYTQQTVLPVDLARWLWTNKIPYYNMSSLMTQDTARDAGHIYGQQRKLFHGMGGLRMSKEFLPSFISCVDKIHRTNEFVRTAECIIRSSRVLFSRVPLPPLPPPSAKELCHTLIQRLKLPESIQNVVDRVLTALHTPQFVVKSSTATVRRFDGECLAVIATVLRLLYGLDDQFEFLPADSADQTDLNSGNAMFVWTDWVRLYLEHRLQTERDGIPMNESELERLKDCRKYLDFCKDQVFTSRPKPSRAGFYNPEWFKNISEIFTKHSKRLQSQQEGSSQTTDTQGASDSPDEAAPFSPRLIPLDHACREHTSVLENYELLPQRRRYDHVWNVELGLSHSMMFLLDVCCELVHISHLDFYYLLLFVQGSLLDGELLAFERLSRYLS